MKKFFIIAFMLLIFSPAHAEYVNVDDLLNVRSSSQLNSTIIDTLPRNHYVTVQYKTNGWAYIKYFSNQLYKYGWVKEEYLKTDRISEHSQKLTADNYIIRISALEKNREFAKALSLANQFVYNYPQHAYAYYIRGIAYNGLNNYNQAILDYTKSLSLNIQNDLELSSMSHLLRGKCYYQLNQIDKSLEDYNKVSIYYLKKLPRKMQEGYYYEKGTMEFDLSKYNYSINDFSKLIEINPSPINYVWRALSSVMIGEYKSAQNDMNIVDNLCQYDNNNECKTALQISRDIRPYLYDTSY